MAKLIVRTGRNEGTEFKLGAGRHIMGRRSVCPIPIADVKASREHAAVTSKDGNFYVQDLSRNGTLINGLAASRAEPGTQLKFGDKIRIGDTTLELIDEKAELADVQVPGYEILERIGAGGMGTVFKARQMSMDRIVALKVLNERYSANSEFVDRFIREARAAGKLNHPNVIHVHDIFHANGRHYFSMEFVDGSTVKELLRLQKKIDFKKALDIVLQCGRALEFAHENHIIHRDIKPDNIMLTKEGIVKIADLGIAKTFEEAAPSAKEQRRVMGTPHYMAPEQALGKAIDHRVDIYSLGATFYHMLTGNTPFSGNTAHEILKAHIQESLPAIQEFTPSVPDPVCFIVERMMAKLPEKRYASMAKLIEDVERAQAGVAAGIDRIQAGDSTVMRALDKSDFQGEEGGAEGAAEDAVVTGQHAPARRLGLALALAFVFALTAAGVILLAHKLTTGPSASTNSNGHKEVVPPPVQPPDLPKNNAAAKNLLADALDAEKRGDLAAFEAMLKQLKESFPTAAEAEEAGKRLEALAVRKKAEEKQKITALLDEAHKFLVANPGKFAECIEKFRAVETAAAAFPSVAEEAKTRCAELEKQQKETIAKQAEDAWQDIAGAANGQVGKNDYDAARAALQAFLAQNPNNPQKDSAQKLLDTINEKAQERWKSLKDKIPALSFGEATKQLNDYAAQVKDASSANELQAELASVDEKAHKQVEEDLKIAKERAKKFQFQLAITLAGKTENKVAGTKYVDEVKAKEEDFKKQEKLYQRVKAAIQDQLKANNQRVQLDFPLNPLKTKLGENYKWAICKLISDLDGDTLDLMPVNEDNVPGAPSKRICDLTSKEQYDLFHQFLGKKLSPADHEALAAFCREHGEELAKEQEFHEKQAVKAQ